MWYTAGMKHFIKLLAMLSALALFIVPTFAGAQTFSNEFNTYTDTQLLADDSKLAISVLSEAKIVQGNPDGSYRPLASLNRAEFVTLAFRLAQRVPSSPVNQGVFDLDVNCFADVRAGAWYAEAVCTAQALGIVEGYPDTGTTLHSRLFKPSDPVSYVEAVKILVETLGVDVASFSNGTVWYQPYVSYAQTNRIALTGVQSGANVTRLQIAHLVALFYTYTQGELDAYLAAQMGPSSSSSSSSSSTSSSSSSVSSASSTSTSSSSSSSNGTYDPNPVTQVRSNFIVLGTTGPAIGAATIFSEDEPVRITEINITLTAAVDSLSLLKVYDDTGLFLGNATRQSNTVYSLPLSTKNYVVAKAEETSFYARAQAKNVNAGGTSGEQIQVDSIGITAEGEWSNSTQTVLDTSDYPIFETTAAELTTVTGGTRFEDIFLAGNGVRIGTFTFAGQTHDSQADAQLTDVFITANTTAGVTLSNIELRDNASGEQMTCTFTTVIECTNIPAGLGDFEDETRTLTVYADVSAPAGEAYLQLRLNDSGSPTNPGDIRWTDGFSNHTWVYADDPIAESTIYRR